MRKILLDCFNCPARSRGLFRHLRENEIGEINEKKCVSLYAKNQYIFLERQKPSGVYCIHSGRVKIVKQIDSGKEFIVRHSESGDLLGYRALLSRDVYNACGQAMDDCILCFIEVKDFEKLLQENEKFARALLEKLAFELGVAEERLRDVSLHPARSRLARYFLQALEELPSEAPAEIPFYFSRKDLAGLLGMTQQTLIRILTEWKKHNIVQFNDRTCTIFQPDILRKELSTVKMKKRI